MSEAINATAVVPEDPSVVKGGPLDPTSPEGQPPEGHNTGTEIHSPSPAAPQAPLYKGLTGDLTSAEDLVKYTKSLEDMFVQANARNAIQSPINNLAITPVPAVPAGPTFKEKYAELAFSKPEEAADILVQEAKRQMKAENDQLQNTERQVKQFWEKFYVKNADLKRVDSIVQSIVQAKNSEIRSLRTEGEVEEFLSKETRKVIDLVKKESGFVETPVPSGRAVSFGGSGDPAPTPPKAPTGNLNFSDQIRRLKPTGRR